MAGPTSAVSAPTPPSSRDVFALAWPLAANAIMLMGIVIVDTILVSPLGEEALAAMGLATAFVGLITGLLHSLTHATQILVAQAKGAKDPVALKSSVVCGVLVAAGLTGLGLLLIALFANGVIDSMAHTPNVARMAKSYLYVFFIVVACEIISQVLTAYFNGTARAKLPFYSILIEIPINIACSIVLIYGLWGAPEMGLVGAAVGSAVAAVIRLVILSGAFLKADWHILDAAGWSGPTLFKTTIRHMMFSLPIAGTFFGNSVANTVCTLMFARLSVNEFAAMTLILPWVQVLGKVMIAWAQATGIFVGQLLGGQTPDDQLDSFIARNWRVAFGLAVVVTALLVGANLSFPFVYGNLQPPTLTALASFLPVLLLISFPKVSNAMCGQSMRAGGDTLFVMNANIVSNWVVRVPVTAVLILFLDAHVAWVFAVYLLEEVVKFPLFHKRFFSGVWKTKLARHNAK